MCWLPDFLWRGHSLLPKCPNGWNSVDSRNVSERLCQKFLALEKF